MGLLNTLGTGQAFLKAGFLGFPKSGKTWTSAVLAIGTREFLKLEGPIAMFDTEGGSEYIAPMIRKATGKELIGLKSRSFDQLVEMTDECVSEGVSVLIAESMTHVWRELCDAYLQDINQRLKYWADQNNRSFKPKRRLEFQDWAFLKATWNKWTDLYLNAPLHIIIAGRAGFEYDFEENEETHKKELIKTGIKMKTEGEFGFEPSLLVEMERVQDEKDGSFSMKRRARVIGDRFSVIDGKEGYDPTFEFFKPHVELLKPGAYTPIDTSIRTRTGADEDGGDGWAYERRQRAILCEEIQGEITNRYPGQTAVEKKAKLDLIADAFGTRSWTKVESLDSGKLKAGLDYVRAALSTPGATPEAGESAA